MDRPELILSVLSISGNNFLTPIKIQKLFFLIDRKLAGDLHNEQPFFQFEPFHYGPFDRQVYIELAKLSDQGFLTIDTSSRIRKYSLTDEGILKGVEVLGQIEEPLRNKIQMLSKFVQGLSFSQLISSIYKEYPEMKVNSIFG